MHETPIQIAFSQYGIKEIAGKQDNPEVLKYFDFLGFGNLNDETSWCSAFVNWCVGMAGLPYTKKLYAVSWLDWGVPVDSPQFGDVVVFWRGAYKGEPIAGSNIMKGHVAFFITARNGWIWVLGGNQGDKVQISAYPETKLLAYRRANNAI